MRYIVIPLVALVVGCSAPDMTPHQVTKAEMDLVIDKLNLPDPYSVRVKELRAGKYPNGTTLICGQMNAKNAFGAYAGYEYFSASIYSPTSIVVTPGDLSVIECGSALPINTYPGVNTLPAI